MSASAPAHIQANRANAELSTGPRTPEGKARSAQNSLQHGLTAKTALLPNEAPRPYHEFRAKLVADLHPQGALEDRLAETMADVQWRLRRIRSLEYAVTEIDPVKQIDALAKLALYEQRLTRTFQTTLKQLQQLQTARRALEERQITDAAAILKLCRTKQIPYAAAENGFVFSESQIDAWLLRRTRLEEATAAAKAPSKQANAA